MTFTTQIKDEITKNVDSLPDALASLCAYLKFNSKIEDYLSVYTENASVARWLFKLIKTFYNIDIKLTVRTINRFKKKNIYILDVKDKKNLIVSDIDNTIFNISRASNEEKVAFLKGIFLSSGSINDPKKNKYHLEFFVKEEKYAAIINDLLSDLGFTSKYIKNGNNYMIYIKKSENISDFINYIGARNALFYFEDIRIYKDHKNMVNRLNNCEQANMEKTLKSSNQVLDNINYLEENDLIDLVEGRLKEVIDYKKKYPETSFSELASIISLETEKSITRSGINHYFRKIDDLVKKHKSK